MPQLTAISIYKNIHDSKSRDTINLSTFLFSIQSGKWQEWIVDGTHANVWNDQGKAELAKSRTGDLNGSSFILEATLMPNSVTSVELLKP